MSDWYTAAELAGLQGLPKSARNIRIKAEKEEWCFRKRAKGKGNEYSYESLPLETRKFLSKLKAETLAKADKSSGAYAAKVTISEINLKEKVDREARQKLGEKSMLELARMNDRKREKVMAKLAILRCYDVYIQPFKAIKEEKKGLYQFVDDYRCRQLDLPDSVYNQVKTISKNFKYRWKAVIETQGAAALAGNYNSKTKSIVDSQQEMADFLVALLCEKPHLAKKPTTIRNILLAQKELKYSDWQVPGKTAVHKWIGGWIKQNQARFTYITDPDKYNSSHRPLYSNMYPQISGPNEIWEFDSTPIDALLSDGSRYSIIGVIDVFTRRVKLLVSPTSDSEGICLLLRKTILDWGMMVPDGIARTDNGSDYVSKRVTALFETLGWQQSRANAYSGWEKPFIERFFRTLSHSIVELLPGFIGHNVAERSQIEAAKSFAERLAEKRKPDAEKDVVKLALSAEELQRFFDDWVDAGYHHKSHSGLNNQTPFTVYQNTDFKPIAISDPHSLDWLLNQLPTATVIRGKVTAKGLGIKYCAPELMEDSWDRKEVRVFVDPTDVGRAMLHPLHDQELDYVEAYNEDLIGKEISPEEFRKARKAEQKAQRKFRKAAKELAEKMGVSDVHADALAYMQMQKEGLEAFPKPSTPADNEVLDMLSGHQKLADANEPTEAELEALKAQRDARRKAAEVQAPAQAKMLRDEQTVAWDYAKKKAAGGELTEKEEKWLQMFMRNYMLTGKRIKKFLDETEEKKANTGS